DFTIVDQPTASTIALGSNASWLVVLQAHSQGPKQASFAVDYDGGSAMIPLTGEGVGATDGGGGGGGNDDDGDTPGGRASYYACSTGKPSALSFRVLTATREAIGTVHRGRRSGAPQPASARACRSVSAVARIDLLG